jgi:hypothetical protein
MEERKGRNKKIQRKIKKATSSEITETTGID